MIEQTLEITTRRRDGDLRVAAQARQPLRLFDILFKQAFPPAQGELFRPRELEELAKKLMRASARAQIVDTITVGNVPGVPLDRSG